MSYLSWEQKIEALKATGANVEVVMVRPGAWYVALRGAEIKNGALLTSVVGHGASVEVAANTAFENATALDDKRCVVVHAMREDRRAIKWNGFMWAPHQEAI